MSEVTDLADWKLHSLPSLGAKNLEVPNILIMDSKGGPEDPADGEGLAVDADGRLIAPQFLSFEYGVGLFGAEALEHLHVHDLAFGVDRAQDYHLAGPRCGLRVE